MKQFWTVVLIWYICVNENYLFTRAEYLSSTIPLKQEDIKISCNNNSLLLQIWNVTVPQDIRSCENHKCALGGRDDKDIKRRCNGANICKPNVNLTSKCLVKQPIGTYEISYNCKVTCDFERDQCSFDKATNKDTFPKWTRIKANTIGNGAFEDHTTGSGNGSMMYFESNNVPIARMKSPTITLNDSNNNEWIYICIKFWLISFDPNYKTNALILYNANNGVIGEYHLVSQGVWENFIREVQIPNGHIIFEADLRILNGSLGLDDISISLSRCKNGDVPLAPSYGVYISQLVRYARVSSDVINFNERYQCITDTEQTYSHCANWNADLRLNNCPTLFMRRLQIHFTDIDPLSAQQQNCSFSRRIASAVIKHCIQNYTLDYCDINLSKVVSSYNYTCPVPHKSIYLEYVCKENNTYINDTTKASTLSTSAKTQRTYPISETTTSVAKLTQTVSYTPQGDVITDSFESNSPSSTPVTGIVVGVVLSLVALSVILVIAFIYYRRSRYAEKKGHSVVANEDIHSDYTSHQNTAFSPDVNVTTQTDYCEIRTSKHNDQYHDITDTFSSSINTINDDEYSEIANVVNSTNNPNASTNYQHQYISLDPNATGFNRSNPQTNLNNETKINDTSIEKTSLVGGDDYAILDPDDLNESKNNTPKVLPLSENYVVLDPNETGFNRKNTDIVCNYELATPINPTETSEDPYDVSKDETYDTSCNSRHKEKENNIYSHTVDNVYDTAGNQHKKEDNDGTYDHFFGQQSEDDYDISKPL